MNAVSVMPCALMTADCLVQGPSTEETLRASARRLQAQLDVANRDLAAERDQGLASSEAASQRERELRQSMQQLMDERDAAVAAAHLLAQGDMHRMPPVALPDNTSGGHNTRTSGRDTPELVHTVPQSRERPPFVAGGSRSSTVDDDTCRRLSSDFADSQGYTDVRVSMTQTVLVVCIMVCRGSLGV